MKEHTNLFLYRPGLIGAYLDEYERAIAELKVTIGDLSDSAISIVLDPVTTDLNCRSIQSILSHIVQSGFAYVRYVRLHFGKSVLEKNLEHFGSISEYNMQLDACFQYTLETFQSLSDEQMTILDPLKKINTSFRQTYDPEQMLEHAIVHILKHRRQIEKFKKLLTSY